MRLQAYALSLVYRGLSDFLPLKKRYSISSGLPIFISLMFSFFIARILSISSFRFGFETHRANKDWLNIFCRKAGQKPYSDYRFAFSPDFQVQAAVVFG